MEMMMEYFEMNEDQKNAVDKVMQTQDYTLIQGMPGTGKTYTISFIVRLLVTHGKRVLITSYTHSAVDNVLLKLTKVGLDAEQPDKTRPVLRVGDSARCHGDVQHLLVENVAKNVNSQASQGDNYASPESQRHCVKGARVVGVTALTIPTSSLLAGEHFDVVIVDEAGQISQPAIIGALMAADTFILVGDHKQLPPLVNSELAEKGGFGVSLFRTLAEAHPNHVAQLTYQYRMAEDICQLTNDITYKGKLKCGSDSVKFRRLELQGYPDKVSQSVYKSAIDPDKAVIFLDTDQQKHNSNEILSLETTGERQFGGVVNKTEATIVARIVESLISCRVAPSSIGIICPFNAQVKLIESTPQMTEWKSKGLECSTIDRYQGRDKPVVVLSFVRSNNRGKVGRLLGDFRRLNVAVSRAECKLIMIGSLSTLLEGSAPLRSALERLIGTDKIVRVAG
jgi:DNA replication ATP-dependent helicase Dna2